MPPPMLICLIAFHLAALQATAIHHPSGFLHVHPQQSTRAHGAATLDNLVQATIPAYILTVRNEPINQQRMTLCAETTKGLGFSDITAVEAVGFHEFFPRKDELLHKYLFAQGEEAFHDARRKANLNLFKAFRQEFHFPTQFPKGFEEAAIKELAPGQLSVYLGHWAIWEKVAKRSDGEFCLVLEDDARLTGSLQSLKSTLHQIAPTIVTPLVDLAQSCFQRGFRMGNTMGYVLTPETARQLMKEVSGGIPVDWAINKVEASNDIRGMCPPATQVSGSSYSSQTSKALLAALSRGPL